MDEALSAGIKASLEVASIIPGLSEMVTTCKIVSHMRGLYKLTSCEKHSSMTGVEIIKKVTELTDKLAVADHLAISRLLATLSCITATDKVIDIDIITIDTIESVVDASTSLALLIPAYVPIAVGIKIATSVAIAMHKVCSLEEIPQSDADVPLDIATKVQIVNV
jgi:NAD-dependent DNA ligase